MRICYLADAGSIHTLKWIKYFADKGHEVHLISSVPCGENKIEKVKLHLLSNFPTLINLPAKIIQVIKLIKKIKPDIVHAHYVTGSGYLGGILSGLHPLVVSAMGSDILIASKKSKMMRPVVKYLLKKADLITCDGENTKKEMITLGADSKKIRLIYHGVDTKKFTPTQKLKNLRAKLGISNSPIVISLRSLQPKYDVETLIKAVHLVLKEFPKTKLIVAGDGAQKAYLKNMANSLEVLDSIKFVGQIPHNQLPYYLTLANVYVSTSLSDGGISISTLEAMACGIVPVVTDVGDNKKWIKDGKNGFVVPMKDPKALSEKIVLLIKDKKFQNKIKTYNRMLIVKRQDYYKEMKKMEDIYKNLIKR